ncbi:conserved exported hypothetical protein [Methylocella tundrae]|uniref:Translation initiation factor IF-2 n=1 Tax=Methylocella tundrae TaxID=227605 RepID=A0A8B6MA60_METTU|nr:hypothetical protein [Methylocella tundrae]VTZ26643.1 conserved exported hypothetical protein [Methylocella tundrae]VTZ50944.1 conserved exported hypothetical protein [Methylocella tundrae]
MRKEIPLILAAAVGFYAIPAVAQTAPGAPGGNEVIPEKNRAIPSAQPKDGVPLTSGRSGSLSDRLDAGDGVIKPKPGVDPGIVRPAPVPNPNSTPVIPPAGTPGGPPGAEPK